MHSTLRQLSISPTCSSVCDFCKIYSIIFLRAVVAVRARPSASDYSDFLFCETGKASMSSLLPAILSAGASSLCAVALLSQGSPVSLACIPIIVPMTLSAQVDESAVLTDDAKNLVKGLRYTTILQASLAACDLVMGDLLGGFMKMGVYVTRPEGLGFLPSFCVISFVNGSMTFLGLLERLSNRSTPLFSGSMPLYLNYLHLEQMLMPVACFSAAFLAWQLIREVRRMTVSGGPPPDHPPARSGRFISAAVVSLANPQPGGNFVPFAGSGFQLGGPRPPVPSPNDN